MKKGDLLTNTKDDTYGTYLTTDSQGRIVVEVFGDKGIAAWKG